MNIAGVLITIIQWVTQLLILLIVIQAVLSFFMSPFHPVRSFLDRIVGPLLRPIQRVVPPLASIDFSPLILIILLQVIESLLIRLILFIA